MSLDRLRDAEGTETEPSFAAAGETRTCEDGLLTATIDRVSVNRKTSAPNGAVSAAHDLNTARTLMNLRVPFVQTRGAATPDPADDRFGVPGP